MLNSFKLFLPGVVLAGWGLCYLMEDFLLPESWVAALNCLPPSGYELHMSVACMPWGGTGDTQPEQPSFL